MKVLYADEMRAALKVAVKTLKRLCNERYDARVLIASHRHMIERTMAGGLTAQSLDCIGHLQQEIGSLAGC